jgi:glucokinase
MVLKTNDYPSFKAAWDVFRASTPAPLPRDAAIAVACPTDTQVLRLTNVDWFINQTTLSTELGVERCTILNDFAAVAHAVQHAPHDEMIQVCGPDSPLPRTGTISVVGPGTGLGVAQVFRTANSAHVIATEGGHIGFAPSDEFEDELLVRLRARFGRVSAERIAAGPGLVEIHRLCAVRRGLAPPGISDQQLWTTALDGSDDLLSEALDRFCKLLGSVAGDLALAQGANAVVIAGGVGLRLADRLARSAFQSGLVDKGRFRSRLEAMPVRLLTTKQPGLLGAALSFAQTNR